MGLWPPWTTPRRAVPGREFVEVVVLVATGATEQPERRRAQEQVTTTQEIRKAEAPLWVAARDCGARFNCGIGKRKRN